MDAKHNLELALQKLQQPKQKQPDEKMDPQDPDNGENEEYPQNKGNRPQPNGPDRQHEDTQNNRKDPVKMQPKPPIQREGSIALEQAEKILDAVRNQELEQQRKRLESLSRRKTDQRDW